MGRDIRGLWPGCQEENRQRELVLPQNRLAPIRLFSKQRQTSFGFPSMAEAVRFQLTTRDYRVAFFKNAGIRRSPTLP